MFKFVHIADVHFDTIFATKEKQFRDILRNALYKAFSKAVDICIEKEVHGLLIAGDLFESSEMSFKTERFIMKEFKRLESVGVQVFYAIGNHDVGINHQKRNLEWPENVHIFDMDQVVTVKVVDEKTGNQCNISSCGHVKKNESRNLIPLFPLRKDGDFHIGLVHTMVTNASFIDNDCYYLPCKIEDLESKDYDYWALGHIHKRQQLGNTSIYYPGNPQGLKSKETGEKGILYIEIDNSHHTETQFIQTSPLVWKNLSVDISKCNSNDQLIKIINESLIKEGITDGTSHEFIPKVNLVGRSVLKHVLNQGEYVKQLKEEILDDLQCPELIIKTDELRAAYNKESIENGNHIVSEILNVLKTIDTEKEVMSQLMTIPLANNAINSSEDQSKYIRSLINNLDDELIDSFLEVRDED